MIIFGQKDKEKVNKRLSKMPQKKP